MKRLPLLLLAGLLFAPLAFADTAPTPADNDPRFITFFDSGLFDGRLYDLMKTKANRLEIDMPGHVELTRISPRLDHWLTLIGQNGTMTLQETEEPPHLQAKLILSFVPLVYSMVQGLRSSIMDDQAKNYDATVYYHKDHDGNALIDRVVMLRKTPQ